MSDEQWAEESEYETASEDGEWELDDMEVDSDSSEDVEDAEGWEEEKETNTKWTDATRDEPKVRHVLTQALLDEATFFVLEQHGCAVASSAGYIL